ncbi:MAG: 16S rRNA methyltransferase, partial [Thermofilum sp.]|nr:16S rRNA methyltransferase [Thermofilum sp.]
MHLLLAEAGLELVPKELWSHPAVRASARRRGKKPGEILLDVALHHSAMVGLGERWKR